MYITGRHGLNYAKLYHNVDGGYEMEQLKTVLKRIKKDSEEGINPYDGTDIE